MDPATRIARKMAALSEMGFQRVESPALPTDSTPLRDGRVKVTCSHPSMGTLVSVTAIHQSSDLIQEAAGLAFREMRRVVDLLNRYESSSALSYLNREGVIVDPPHELTAVMGQARYFNQASRGAFDATVQPLVDLFRTSLGANRAAELSSDSKPTEADLLEALALVDGRKVEVGEKQIRLHHPGMGVTLDGIAKGYVVDRIAQILNQHGLDDFLIDAGGDIRTSGVREDGCPWKVGVQDPRKQGDLPDVIGLTNGSVATSGSYEIYFDRERTHHHIVSALTGASPQTSQSVSVVAPTTLAADALATSVFVMEPERGVVFIESLPQCACLIVDEQGRQWRSKGWRSASDLPTPKAGSP
ncbi:MAG: FAD:protein FMN transferase [Gemmatimonadetes bacterium]|nr:FAD:protein FMN transferase [Gemmatimonadota bacterium]NNM03745.1 FAD:protein FMN transferase [Gemmatimonadota bacterium]